MIKIIYGAKGTGKTKQILTEANDKCECNKGTTVFITDTNKYLYELRSKIRVINVNDFDICTPLGLLGFVRGMIAADYDINAIFIDGLLRIAGVELGNLEDFFAKLKKISDRLEVKITVTISSDTLPDYLKVYAE